MTEPENFVARWSRLKRQSDRTGAAEADAAPQAPAAREPAPARSEQEVAAEEPPAPAFDPASLPPIEAITADTDIRAFLQSGVPAELTKAALRRVWTSDPAIRDYIGLAENQWDFTDPTAMAGFGPLRATDNVHELVTQAMGKLGQPPEQASEQLAEAGAPEGGNTASGVQCSTDDAPGPATPGTQGSGIPRGNSGDARSDAEQGQVSGAVQHAEAPAERGAVPNRRPRGGALPK
jgi:hypothetical protein